MSDGLVGGQGGLLRTSPELGPVLTDLRAARPELISDEPLPIITTNLTRPITGGRL